jgi:hypothetical protein
MPYQPMSRFLNNQQLYDYLLLLSTELKKRGRDELSEATLLASRQASSMSTEFLGESRIALRRVLQEGQNTLTEEERDDIRTTLRQLDEALDKR